MLLSELFDRLALGELNQHKYGKTGAILAQDYPALIHQVNTALTTLYVKFPLKVGEVTLQQQAGVHEYLLHTDYAESKTESAEPVKYLLDADNPFLGNIIRIEAVYDSEGNQVPLNIPALSTSWFTPTWASIHIPVPVPDALATIIYRTGHIKIAPDAVPASTELLLPSCLEEAFQAYIASKCFVSLGNPSSAALASYYRGLYDKQIAQVERDNLLQSSVGDNNNKLNQKGFI